MKVCFASTIKKKLKQKKNNQKSLQQKHTNKHHTLVECATEGKKKRERKRKKIRMEQIKRRTTNRKDGSFSIHRAATTV